MSSFAVPNVEIDADGVFKYIFIKVSTTSNSGVEETKDVVRGYAECEYHTDINDKITDYLQKLKTDGELQDWKTKVLGGGRIDHNAADKTIKVFGYSQGYGKANHEDAVALIKKDYPDYAVTWSDDGY